MANPYDENLLLGYVEDELSDADRARVQGWAARDPKLARLLNELIADRQALSRLPDPYAPPWVMEEVDRYLERSMLLHDRVMPEGQEGAGSWHRLAPAILTGAIAATIAVVGGVVLWSLLSVRDPKSAGYLTNAKSPKEKVVEQPSERSAEPDPKVLAEGPPAGADNPVASPVSPAEAAALAETPSVPPADPASADPAPRLVVELPWRVDIESIFATPPEPDGEAARAATDEQATSPGTQENDTPVRPVGRLYARLDDRSAPALLQLPGQRAVEWIEISTDIAMSAFVELVTRQPQVQNKCRLEIVTRDVQTTWARLAEISGLPQEPGTDPVLRVAPARLGETLIALRADPAHIAVRLLRPRAMDDGASTTERPSPSQPDYVRILSEQLPLSPEDQAQPAPLAIPVVIRSSRG